MAIYALKEITDYYLRNNSPVFICFLDARKAFDRVNHWKLFDKLLDRGMDPHLVNLLRIWYGSQRFHVRWGSSLSAGFYTSNGVRQGGILSPFLFNVYTDNLYALLDSSGYGCHYQDSKPYSPPDMWKAFGVNTYIHTYIHIIICIMLTIWF